MDAGASLTLLAQARLRAGLTQTDAAGRAGVSQGQIAKIEGGRRLPSFRALVALMEAYGIEPGDLPGLLAELARIEAAAPWRPPPAE